MKSFFAQTLFPGLLILTMPMAGVWLAGRPVKFYLNFPPKPAHVPPEDFSPAVFLGLALLLCICIAPFIAKWLSCPPLKKNSAAALKPPWWGYISFAGLILFWILAWNRFEWFKPFQPHTFFPLWLCLILCFNALASARSGHCPMLDSPARFCLLFVISAVFWWLFEYLNRFAGNWYYSASTYPPLTYFFLATLSFSTVLPAVESVNACLLTFPKMQAAFQKTAWTTPLAEHKGIAAGLIFISCVFLLLTGIFPTFVFPCIWICPLLIFTSWQTLLSQKHIFSGLRKGDFTGIVSYSLAALACGFFWEMLNMYNLARWQYSISFVDFARIFEMPVLGYAGYLPFGLECAVIIRLVFKQT